MSRFDEGEVAGGSIARRVELCRIRANVSMSLLCRSIRPNRAATNRLIALTGAALAFVLDSLGRSLPYQIETVTALEGRGVGFRSLTEAINCAQ